MALELRKHILRRDIRLLLSGSEIYVMVRNKFIEKGQTILQIPVVLDDGAMVVVILVKCLGLDRRYHTELWLS